MTVIDCAREPHMLAHTRVDPPLRQIAVGRGLVVGLSRSEDEARLHAWSGDPLELIAAGPSWEGIAAEGLALDSEHARAVVWGLQGGSCRSRRRRAVRAPCAVGAGTVTELWNGAGAPAEPNGFLLPLAGGSLGVYDQEGLVVIAAGRWLPTGAWPGATSRRPSPRPTDRTWRGSARTPAIARASALPRSRPGPLSATP